MRELGGNQCIVQEIQLIVSLRVDGPKEFARAESEGEIYHGGHSCCDHRVSVQQDKDVGGTIDFGVLGYRFHFDCTISFDLRFFVTILAFIRSGDLALALGRGQHRLAGRDGVGFTHARVRGLRRSLLHRSQESRLQYFLE